MRIAWSTPAATPVPGAALPGRGAWLHPDPACAALLSPAALSRALRQTVTPDGLAALLAGWPPQDG